MSCMHEKYNPADPEDRRRVIASAVASQLVEGLELDDESLADLEKFVSGAMSLSDVKKSALARFTAPDPT